MLPFTREQFLEAFAAYNDAVWPLQPLAYVLGLIALVSLVQRSELNQRLALAIMGLMWIWTGVAYHWIFFSEINAAAVLFGLLFVVEGAVLGGLAFRHAASFSFRWRPDLAGWAAAALLLYALIVYPLIDLLLGNWPRMPWFGISPCPVTLFTLGFLLLAHPRPPFWLWAIPIGWSLIGGTASFLLGIPQDWVLLASGPAAALIALGDRDAPRQVSPEAAMKGEAS